MKKYILLFVVLAFLFVGFSMILLLNPANDKSTELSSEVRYDEPDFIGPDIEKILEGKIEQISDLVHSEVITSKVVEINELRSELSVDEIIDIDKELVGFGESDKLSESVHSDIFDFIE